MYKEHIWRRRLISLVYPNRCPFCGGIIAPEPYYCEECFDKLEVLDEPISGAAGADGAFAVCRYSGTAREAVLRLKNGSYRYAADAFAVLLAERLGDILRDIDIITATPTGLYRRAELGYAQAELIAKNIAKRAGLPFKRLFEVTGSKREQKTLTPKQRRENAETAFRLIDKSEIASKNILIVDDVMTTGSTISAMSRQLKSGGAARVYGGVFAYAGSSAEHDA